MRYTIHQIFINLMSDTVLSFFVIDCCLTICLIDRCMTADCFCDQLFCLADTICNLTLDHRLTCKTIHWNLCICCHNNTCCFLNFSLCENIFGSTGTSCFNFYPISKFFCFFLNCFCCHISMCNSCWTSGNCKD